MIPVRTLAWALVALLAASACGGTSPPESASPSPSEVVVATTITPPPGSSPSAMPSTPGSGPADDRDFLLRAQVLFYWSVVRDAYPWLPDAEVSIRRALRTAYYGGLSPEGRAKIQMPHGLGLPLRDVTWHEAGHASFDVAKALTGSTDDQIMTAYWNTRGLPGTWQDQEKKAAAARSAGASDLTVHQLLPTEMFADSFAAVGLDGYPDGKAFPDSPFHRAKMKAFYDSLPTFLPKAINVKPLGTLEGQWSLALRGSAPAARDPSGGPKGLVKLWAAAVAGGDAREFATYLGPFDPRVRDTNVLSRQVSPDGRKVVLSVPKPTDSGAWRYGLVVATIETGELRDLTFDPTYNDLSPAWSTDGTRVAFVRQRSATLANAGLWLLDARGGQAQQLLGPQTTVSKIYGWSADSTAITYSSSSDGQSVAVLDLGSRRLTQLPGTSASRSPMSWRTTSPKLVLALNQPSSGGPTSRLIVADSPADPGAR